MESTTARITEGAASLGDKGLKTGAIGLISSVVIGVASTPHKLLAIAEVPVMVVPA